MTATRKQPAAEPGRPLDGRIALVTGASKGIGAAVARLLARKGAHVILLARSQGGLEEQDDAIRAEGGQATLFPSDLIDHDRIDAMGAAIHERFRRLDILIGNAGILGPLTPTSHIEPKAWDKVMAINLTANYRLIRSLEPLLRLSEAGRAVFVTSGAADGHHAYWGAYGTAKAGLEALVRTWAEELRKTRIRINLVNPGGTRTAMRAEAFPGEDPATLPTPEEVAEVFLPLVLPGCAHHGEILQARALMQGASGHSRGA